MIYFPLTLLAFFLFLLFFFFFFKLFPCLLPDLSKGKQALRLVSRSSALDNLSFQPVWKSGNPYAWNLIIDISAAGRVIRPITASWIQGRENGWLHSLGLLFRYSALNGLILIYLPFPWRRTTNCTEKFVSRYAVWPACCPLLFQPSRKGTCSRFLHARKRQSLKLDLFFFHCQSLCGREAP